MAFACSCSTHLNGQLDAAPNRVLRRGKSALLQSAALELTLEQPRVQTHVQPHQRRVGCQVELCERACRLPQPPPVPVIAKHMLTCGIRRRVGRVDTLGGRQVDVLHTNGSGGRYGVAAYKLTQGDAVAECNHALLALREAEIELQPAELLVVLPEASR